MELKVSSVKPEGLSPVDCSSDPEEKEISDEDDDDRNHKHRRRESHSQSVERDSLEPAFTRPYRKRNKPFENGHIFRESESQASENWKHYNSTVGKDFTTKFDKRRPGLASLPRAPLDQRFRPNQTFPGELGSGRGRARDSGSWGQRDSRFSSADFASQMVQQGSITPNLFRGRGLANVSNAQGASWNTFGLISGLPNGGLDPLHSIALQGTLGPAVNSSLHMGIHRQRCRDFEERGFCLRGDMCPMEHGVNRIVIEDVQSLSQFNLPVSLSSAQLAGTTAAPATLPSVGAPSATLMNNKGVHSKTNKAGIADDNLGLNGVYSGSVSVTGADLYDPDQPLWNNNGPETSTALLALRSPKNDENESLVSADLSDRHHVRVRGSTDDSAGARSTNSSVWGRIRAMEKKLDVKEKTDSAVSGADYLETETKEDQDVLGSTQSSFRQGKQIIAEGVFSKSFDSSAKIHGDSTRNARKPSQKALRTLFVNGIPQKSNKREALLSHFQKFGEVVDIYIPLNSERAFVQFSKREEAEAALRAPDAVMGNRFIKLWWANRDSIPDDGASGSSSVSVTPRGVTAAVPPHPPSGSSGKEIVHASIPKGPVNTASISDASPQATDYSKPVIAKQKKLESLEQLKEELRKKQELLDQKRNDFRRKLVKLEKQATGVKGEVVSEPAAKRHKVATSADVGKVTVPRSSDSGADFSSSCAEVTLDKNNSPEIAVSTSPKTNTAVLLRDVKGAKQPIHPVAPVPTVSPLAMNRYKLDNRPTAFRVLPPLPTGLANVAALKEHFSCHGEILTVDIEDAEPCGNDANADAPEIPKNCAARVNFTTRQSAERAFLNGKCWQGHNLKFMWVTSTTSSNESGGRENSAASKDPIGGDGPSVKVLAMIDSLEASASGNGERAASEKYGSDELAELHEVSQSHSASVSEENESPEYKHNSNSKSGGEELTEEEPSPAAMSEDKDSPEGVAS
ncbi:hypothetical protein Tsubulata_004738 [Turnera subulata]|uniref:Zinc finger CCCH domain-containing protein 41 n=1 Tax=Turnera subulata TaxID=218843 RepID=A0A9Q0FHB9_9ROSI|nr:hypothetical protein Tsubulata_004738 [Turnera subulata]